MILSKLCIYGIQAANVCGVSEKTDYVAIGKIAAELNISFHFLTKVRLFNKLRPPDLS